MSKNGLNSTWRTGTILLLILLPAAGCVEQRLTIHTEPSDAVVWLNDEEIGTTPVTVGFNWYGDYKVRVEKNGYQILNTHKVLPRPSIDRFPLDFFAQVLWPGTIHKDYAWTFTLEPAVYPGSQQLLEEAAQFKQQADKELQQSREEETP